MIHISSVRPNKSPDPTEQGPAEQEIQPKNSASILMTSSFCDERRDEINGHDNDYPENLKLKRNHESLLSCFDTFARNLAHFSKEWRTN